MPACGSAALDEKESACLAAQAPSPLAQQRALWQAARDWQAGEPAKAAATLDAVIANKETPEPIRQQATGVARSHPGAIMRWRLALALCCFALTSCERIDRLLGEAPAEFKRAPGERIDVMLAEGAVAPDPSVEQVAVEIPDPTDLAEWHYGNDAMGLAPHLAFNGVTHRQSVSIGDGNAFSRSSVPAPVVAAGLVFAMDARGIVSAYDEKNLDSVRWQNEDGIPGNVYDVLGGGLVYDQGVLYVTTGFGNLRALDAATGKIRWQATAGAPVRGAPAIGAGMVIVLTADNQTLAFDAATGQPRWDHRGIRESAGFFSTTSPVVSEGIVIAAYSSGEVFALRAETGSVLWSDTLRASGRTRADAVFSGIDADPIVQDGVVVLATASGLMQASALINGRPLWQAKIGSHRTPWSAGNALFVLSDNNELVALFKRSGAVRWSKSLAQHDHPDKRRDTTPPLYGPILAGNAVLIVTRKGELMRFKPEDGSLMDTAELVSGIASNPVIANGALYLVTQDATLVKYH